MRPVRLVLATRNDHKVAEFARVLAEHEVLPLPEEVVLPPETGSTFAENARIKARAACAALGAAAIADDSGIESAALDGRPGVYSARFAGEDATDEENLRKLVAEAPAGSALRYVCAIAYVDPDGVEHVVEGYCTGVLDPDVRGTNGFGYDPCFVPDDIPGTRTMAEVDPAEKDAISHRGRAVTALEAWLRTRT